MKGSTDRIGQNELRPPGGGVDSAAAKPHPSSGFMMAHRDYGTGNCTFEVRGKVCGQPFKKTTANANKCPEHSTLNQRIKRWKG